jgi:phosphate transport system protein
MPLAEHTTRAFDLELSELAQLIAEMGGRAERQLIDAVDALVKRDVQRGTLTVASDRALDALQDRIQQLAVQTIARRQPMAVDLRQLVGILRIASELERIGDLATNIGKRVIALNGAELPRGPMRGVSSMVDMVLGHLGDVLDGFARRDTAKAIDVWHGDQRVDALYASVFQEIITVMSEDPAAVRFGIHLSFCTKNLECVGDHIANIAETIHYMVEGRTLRSDQGLPVANWPAAVLAAEDVKITPDIDPVG